jgi:hypothetical protein
VRTQIELGLSKEEADLVTAPGSPAPSATATVPAIAPSTQILLEKYTEVNKYPQVSQILGDKFYPSDSRTNKLI